MRVGVGVGIGVGDRVGRDRGLHCDWECSESGVGLEWQWSGIGSDCVRVRVGME